jgi:hypothetical protein
VEWSWEVLLKELIGATSRLYAKSEWAPASTEWPALSFSRRAVANAFSGIYTRGTDFVISVGTSNPKDTQNPEHRQRLLSIVDVEPKIIISTADLVDPEAWRRAQQGHPARWSLSMPIVRAWSFDGFPDARQYMTATYQKFANPTTRGRPIPVEDADHETLLRLAITPTEIPPRIEEQLQKTIIPADKLLNREIVRVIDNIMNATARSHVVHVGFYPDRRSLSYTDLLQLIQGRWYAQTGCCNLCGCPIELGGKNPLLKMSPDRIDSTNKSYDVANVHLTHVGCNLAKNDASIMEWQEYLAVVRNVQEDD